MPGRLNPLTSQPLGALGRLASRRRKKKPFGASITPGQSIQNRSANALANARDIAVTPTPSETSLSTARQGGNLGQQMFEAKLQGQQSRQAQLGQLAQQRQQMQQAQQGRQAQLEQLVGGRKRRRRASLGTAALV